MTTKMEPWHFLNPGDAMLADEPAAEVQECFLKVFQAAGQPSAMAVFTRHESEGRLHCEVLAYFLPPAHVVAQTCGARLCPQPARAGLGLLAGSPQAWQALFLENNP